MLTIGNPSSVKPFAGKVVAYQTDSIFLGNDGVSFDSGKTKFGLIDSQMTSWRNEGYGYNIEILFDYKNSYGNLCPLIHSIYGNHTSMRLATKDEISQIKSGIESKKYEFEGKKTEKQILDILNRCLK